jgi:hypothetical protein
MVFKMPAILKKLHYVLVDESRSSEDEREEAVNIYKPFMPSDMFNYLQVLHETDANVIHSEKAIHENVRFWQGYTGADAAIFVQALTHVWDDVESFEHKTLPEFYRERIGQRGLHLNKLSPAVYMAENVRTRYWRDFLSDQAQKLLQGGE